MNRVYAFPGQGSQVLGMGADLFDQFPAHVRIADDVLGYSLADLCLRDPEGKLSSTRFTQPAVYVVNALSWIRRRRAGQTPDIVLGHSLGEYNALHCAGAFDFATGLQLVKKRAELMAQAPPGAMAAVLGLKEAQVRDILDRHRQGDVDLANLNAPEQIVISGPRDVILGLEPIFSDADAAFIPLNVSAAFHSRGMRFMEAEYSAYLSGIRFAECSIPVIANVTARPYTAEALVKILTAQVSAPVRWSESMDYLHSLGPLAFEELGPGAVLTGLLQANPPDLRLNPAS
jgi:malonyl CoA-acyl carrier protein transacylase